jgi:hypothetical protein
MFRGLESDQRIVKPISLPIRLGLLPTALVARQSEDKFVVSPILISLIGVGLWPSVGWGLHPWGSHQGQAKRIVIWLVGAILAIGENRGPETSRLIG